MSIIQNVLSISQLLVVGFDIPDTLFTSYADPFPVCSTYAMLHVSLYIPHYFPIVRFSDANRLNMLLVVLYCFYCVVLEYVYDFPH